MTNLHTLPHGAPRLVVKLWLEDYDRIIRVMEELEGDITMDEQKTLQKVLEIKKRIIAAQARNAQHLKRIYP